MVHRKLRMGMIGGGPAAFIGAIHRHAIGIDGQIELCCGAFSSDAAKSKEAGKSLFCPKTEAMPVTKNYLKKKPNFRPMNAWIL